MNSNDLRNNRATLIAQARALVTKAESEKRELSGEENEQWNKMMSDVDVMASQIEKAEKAEKLEHLEAELRHSSGRKTSPSAPTSVTFTEKDRKQAFKDWCLAGTEKANSSSDAQYRAAELGINLNSRSYNVRALATSSSASGGATVPTSLSPIIEQKLYYYCPLRNYAFVMNTDSGAPYDWPRANRVSTGATIIGENSSISTTNTDPFDKVSIPVYKYSTIYLQVSTEWLSDSVVDAESVIADLLAKEMNLGQEAHLFLGNGVNQPTGIVTAATPTVNLASTNVMTADKLIDLIYSLDVAYRSQSACMFAHDTTIAQIRKLKDSQNRYLWEPSMQVGQPDTVFGYKLITANQMATSGDNAKLVVFGDPKHYLIRDVSSSLTINKALELFSANGQVGFNLQLRTGANLIGHSGSVVSLNAQDV